MAVRLHLAASVALAVADIAAGLHGRSMALALLSAYALQVAVSATVLLLDGPITRASSARHPYGLGQVEYVTTLGMGVVVMLVVGALAAAAMHSWLDHRLRPPDDWARWVTGATLVACWLMGRQTCRLLRSRSTAALQRHLAALRAQFLAGALVLVAVLLGGAGLQSADIAVAVAQAVLLLWSAGRLIYRSTLGLMDASADPEVVRRMTARVSEAHPVRRSTVKVLQRGPELFVAATVQLDGAMPMADAEQVRRRIARALQREAPGVREVLVDLMPVPERAASGRRTEA